jgi:hypothetical protein
VTPSGRRARTLGVGALALAAAVAAGRSVRRHYLGWGATADERRASLPGDDVLPRADLVATRAVTVAASVAATWPWIVQMGQGRGGLYSYDALENLVGCDIHSADRVVPEWQTRAVGDDFRLHPDVALTVVALEPPRFMVVQGGVPTGETPAPYDFTWAFVLEGRPGDAARLLVRERYAYRRPWAALVVEPVGLVSFVMSRRMLLGIKERAEGARGQA